MTARVEPLDSISRGWSVGDKLAENIVYNPDGKYRNLHADTMEEMKHVVENDLIPRINPDWLRSIPRVDL
jgi:hypothetical protein